MTKPIRFFLPFRQAGLWLCLSAFAVPTLFSQQNLVISGSHTSGTAPCQAVNTITTSQTNPFTLSGSANVTCEARLDHTSPRLSCRRTCGRALRCLHYSDGSRSRIDQPGGGRERTGRYAADIYADLLGQSGSGRHQFLPTQYQLTTNVSSSGGGTISPACSGWCLYTNGSQVALTTTPASGYQFNGFTGNVNSSSNPLTVTMNSAMIETANFTPISTQYQLTTSVSPAGAGTISPASGSYNAGPMTITATANNGYAFSNFTGTYSGTTNPLSINLNGNGTITANFVPGYVITGQVTLAGAGTGIGGVSVTASGSQSATATTDASGHYSLPGLAAGGSYTVTAFKGGYYLSSAQSFTNLSSNQTASFTATPSLSINGGSNTAQVAPGTNVSMTFNLFSSNGANDVSWGQFYLADSAGNAYCMGDWGRPNGLFLYDGDTGATWGFGINQSDSFCTVSLTSITNSATDPTQVTIVLNFRFNPGHGGTYSVLTQINYGSGYAGPWEALGTLMLDPGQVTISGHVTALGYPLVGATVALD